MEITWNPLEDQFLGLDASFQGSLPTNFMVVFKSKSRGFRDKYPFRQGSQWQWSGGTGGRVDVAIGIRGQGPTMGDTQMAIAMLKRSKQSFLNAMELGA